MLINNVIEIAIMLVKRNKYTSNQTLCTGASSHVRLVGTRLQELASTMLGIYGEGDVMAARGALSVAEPSLGDGEAYVSHPESPLKKSLVLDALLSERAAMGLDCSAWEMVSS